MFWQKVTDGNTGTLWVDFVEQIRKLKPGTLWRHNQAGDLPGNRINLDGKAIAQLVLANAGKRELHLHAL